MSPSFEAWVGREEESYWADLPIDAQAPRRSRTLKIENKVGKRGATAELH